MVSKNIAVALALVSAALAAPAVRHQDDCQDAYNRCIAAGTPQVACSCALTTCSGEDSARIREFCATATASLARPTSTGIPGGCNPAHPGSCPPSKPAPPSFTPIPGIPGGCNPAHPGSCPPSKPALPSFTPIPGIPGGCNPAHPGSCPSSSSAYPALSMGANTASSSAPSSAPTSGKPTTVYPNPVPVKGKTWTIKDLTRYCAEDNTGCDYNFAIETEDETERCTVIRMPVSNAATESWYDQPCTTGSNIKVSWGYATEPAPAFAVITIVDGKELAWFGVANVNEQEVTPSNPYGSGQYGDIGPQQVYTY